MDCELMLARDLSLSPPAEVSGRKTRLIRQTLSIQTVEHTDRQRCSFFSEGLPLPSYVAVMPLSAVPPSAPDFEVCVGIISKKIANGCLTHLAFNNHYEYDYVHSSAEECCHPKAGGGHPGTLQLLLGA